MVASGVGGGLASSVTLALQAVALGPDRPVRQRNLRRQRPNSLWIYIISLRTQVHSQIKIHSQIDLSLPALALLLILLLALSHCPTRRLALGRHSALAIQCYVLT